MNLSEITAKLENVAASSDGVALRAKCPVCESPDALEVCATADGGVAVRCYNGCRLGAICERLGVAAAELLGEQPLDKRGRKKTVRAVVESYIYKSAAGDPVYRVDVREGGGRSVSVWDGKRWQNGFTRHGATEIPYRLPDIEDGRWAVICPDERDADAAVKLGLVGLSYLARSKENTFGGWHNEWAEQYFKGQQAVIIARRTREGLAEADKIYQSLKGVCSPCWCVILPVSLNGLDVRCITDYLRAGGTSRDMHLWIMGAPKWDYQGQLAALGSEPQPAKQARAAAKASTVAPRTPSGNSIKVDVIINIGNKLTKLKIDTSKELQEAISSGLAIYTTIIKDKEERKITREECAKVTSEVAVAWMSAHGNFFREQIRTQSICADQSDMYFDSDAKRLYLISGDYFRSWLAFRSGVNWSTGMYQYLLARLHDEVLASGHAQTVRAEMYFCRRGDAIYISNGPGQMVKVSANKIDTVDNGTDAVLFRDGYTLPEWELVDGDGVDPFDCCRLFDTAAYMSPSGKMLARLWLLGAIAARDNKPPLVITGEPGGGKTHFVKGFYEILGLRWNGTNFDAREQGKVDFAIEMNNGGLLCMDNADDKISWFSGAIEPFTTGGEFHVRRLYTHETMVFEARANLVITSAQPQFASNLATSDRMVIIRIGRMIKETAGMLLLSEVQRRRDDFLTWICGVYKKALADKTDVPKALNRRYPDWADFAVRCGRAIGKEDETIRAIKSAEEDKVAYNIENNYIGRMLRDIFSDSGETWQGTASDLVQVITDRAELSERERNDLSPRRIGRQINAIWPSLEAYFSAKQRILHGTTEYTFTGRAKDSLGGLGGLSGLTPYKSRAGAGACNLYKNNQPNPPNPPNELTDEDDLEF